MQNRKMRLASRLKTLPSQNRRLSFLIVLAVAFSIGLIGTNLVRTATAGDRDPWTWINTGGGADGYWDRFGIAGPGVHHRVACAPPQIRWYEYNTGCVSGWGYGDWSLDFYGYDEQPVTWHARSEWDPAAITAQVWAISPTCAVGGGSRGGWTVYVDVYYWGAWEGWMSYGHLNWPQVYPGQIIYTGATLGYLNQWPRSSCYDVSNPAGVHTHIEAYNSSLYSCYWPYWSGTWLNWWDTVGAIGVNYYGIRQPCW
jgi:hypothetical protein